MKEIEIKYKILDRNKLIKKLSDFGCDISNFNHQIDKIYVKDKNNTQIVPGAIFIRIRKNNDKIELNLKRHGSNKLSREEVEFQVSSYQQASDFLELLGFQPWVEVKKERIYSKYKDCNICIDHVEKLGNFVEIEYIAKHNENENTIISKLKEIAEELGIDTSLQINDHYDTMMANKEKVNE